jgi:sugar lactone lactonase YvrE
MKTNYICQRFASDLARVSGVTSLALLLSQSHVNGSDLFVAGYGSGVVQQFNSLTSSSTTFASGLVNPIGLAFDSAGNFYVGDYGASTIYRYGPNNIRTTFATAGLQNPMGLAVDGSGNVYAANLWGNSITKYTPGGLMSVFANVTKPKGLTFDGAGNLYVSTEANTILRYDSLGHSQVFATASMGLNGPLGMQFDTAGNLFVANYFASDILKRDTAGNWSVFAATPPGYSNPAGLALDVDGSMYVTCAGNFIEKYDAQGNGTFFASTVNGPWMIAIKPVPEPSSFVMLIGAAAVYLRSNRKQRGTKSSLREGDYTA